MEAALRALVPRIARDLAFEIHPHTSKNDLIAKLPNRLRGYKAWLPDNWRIVVIVDSDDDDCSELKNRLERIATEVGLITRTAADGGSHKVVNRIAVEELEAWFFGDWKAVRTAYPGVKDIVRKAAYREPDRIKGGTWEALERELRKAGYFEGRLAKIEAATAIAAQMDPARNSSKSFQVLRDTLQEMVA